jgi:ATP-dependent DNA ligase
MPAAHPLPGSSSAKLLAVASSTASTCPCQSPAKSPTDCQEHRIGKEPQRTIHQTNGSLPVEKIPEGDNWTYELKLDGYRLQAVKAGGKVILYSRRGVDLTKRFA